MATREGTGPCVLRVGPVPSPALVQTLPATKAAPACVDDTGCPMIVSEGLVCIEALGHPAAAFIPEFAIALALFGVALSADTGSPAVMNDICHSPVVRHDLSQLL